MLIKVQKILRDFLTFIPGRALCSTTMARVTRAHVATAWTRDVGEHDMCGHVYVWPRESWVHTRAWPRYSWSSTRTGGRSRHRQLGHPHSTTPNLTWVSTHIVCGCPMTAMPRTPTLCSGRPRHYWVPIRDGFVGAHMIIRTATKSLGDHCT